MNRFRSEAAAVRPRPSSVCSSPQVRVLLHLLKESNFLPSISSHFLSFLSSSPPSGLRSVAARGRFLGDACSSLAAEPVVGALPCVPAIPCSLQPAACRLQRAHSLSLHRPGLLTSLVFGFTVSPSSSRSPLHVANTRHHVCILRVLCRACRLLPDLRVRVCASVLIPADLELVVELFSFSTQGISSASFSLLLPVLFFGAFFSFLFIYFCPVLKSLRMIFFSPYIYVPIEVLVCSAAACMCVI